MAELNPEIQGCTVLLIDDEAVIRDVGSQMLEAVGLQCMTAPDGETGIETYTKNQQEIAFVILDIELPGICGDEVFLHLAKINPHVKVLFVSGYSKSYVESQYFRRPLDHFSPKPFQMNDLINKINRLMAS